MEYAIISWKNDRGQQGHGAPIRKSDAVAWVDLLNKGQSPPGLEDMFVPGYLYKVVPAGPWDKCESI